MWYREINECLKFEVPKVSKIKKYAPKHCLF